MHIGSRGCRLALLLLLAAPALAPAQSKVRIDKVRIGFETVSSKKETAFKVGRWVPVYVDLTYLAKLDGTPELVVESPDNEDVPTTYTVPLPILDPGQSQTFLAYTRPGSPAGEMSVSVRLKDGANLCPAHQGYYTAEDLGDYFYLTLGNRLAGAVMPDAADKARGVRASDRCTLAAVTTVNQMPTEWFGYAGVDVVVLNTAGSRTEGFLSDLVNDQGRRRAALAEWVRRGGQLVVSVAGNQEVLAKLPELETLLPVRLLPEGPERVTAAALNWSLSGTSPGTLRSADGFDVARWEPRKDRSYRDVLKGTLTPKEGGRATTRPVAVQAGCGLGKVTLVGLDLSRPPVPGSEVEKLFWPAFLRDEAGPVFRDQQPIGGPKFGGFTSGPSDSSLLGELQARLEYFEGVPVISFGWVALFILVYIVIVGPLDYFFLKKVVKRLELTWVTFPTVVVLVSAVAYLAAYELKGNEQKINKIDVIDIDLQTQETHGTTWFSVFSPRIQNYTLGVEPAAPAWTPGPGPGQASPPAVVTWLSSTRTSRTGFSRRAYAYAPQGAALTGVPIQVWSTKAFAAQWRAPMGPKQPLVESTLRHRGTGPQGLIGTVTSRLPAQLEDVYLLYGGRFYPVGSGRLLPNVTQRIAPDNPKDASAWQSAMSSWTTNLFPQSNQYGAALSGQAFSMPALLFHEAVNLRGGLSNQGLRELDQSWRVRTAYRGDAVLVGRLAPAQGDAEELSRQDATPSRLWVGAWPDGEATRPDLKGKLRQETYVRVYLPIPPGEN